MEYSELINKLNSFDIFYEKSDDPKVFNKWNSILNTIIIDFKNLKTLDLFIYVCPYLNSNGKLFLEEYLQKSFNKVKKISLTDIISAIHKIYGLTFNEYRIKSRKDNILFARYAFMYFTRIYLKMTLKEIGNLLEGMDGKGMKLGSVYEALEIYKKSLKSDNLKHIVEYHNKIESILNE